jgi:hypothetical protein
VQTCEGLAWRERRRQLGRLYTAGGAIEGAASEASWLRPRVATSADVNRPHAYDHSGAAGISFLAETAFAVSITPGSAA